MENFKSQKIYSINQINIATFFGGPLIAGYLLSQNYKVFGDKKASNKTVIISLALTAVLFIVFVLLPRNIIGLIPNLSIPTISVVVIAAIVETYQSKKITEYFKRGYKQASSLGVFAKSIISFLITVITLFLLTQIITFIDVTFNNERYMINYCNNEYNEENIFKNKIYVPIDSSCFVFKRLESKGYTLQQVDKVLILEFEYQKEIGMVSRPNQIITNDSKTYDPLSYIKMHQTTSLSEEQIVEILATEEKYLKLIGAIQTGSN